MSSSILRKLSSLIAATSLATLAAGCQIVDTFSNTTGNAEVGHYLDAQETMLRQQLQGSEINITRVGDEIIVILPGKIAFDTKQADIKPGVLDVLSSVVLVLKKFDQTSVEVAGHTDSRGSGQYNQQLSKLRANSVGNYLTSNGIESARVLVIGYGERIPMADNLSPAGRQLNRRVELILSPHAGPKGFTNLAINDRMGN